MNNYLTNKLCRSLNVRLSNICQKATGGDCPKPEEQGSCCKNFYLHREGAFINLRIPENLSLEHPKIDHRKSDKNHLYPEVRVGHLGRGIGDEKQSSGGGIDPEAEPED